MRITNKKDKWTWVSFVNVIQEDQRSSSLIVLVSKVFEFEHIKRRETMLLYLAAAHSFQYRCFSILLSRLPCELIYCNFLCLVSCSLTCMLTLSLFLIMKRVSSKVHLTILACVLVIFLLSLSLLRRRLTHLHSTLELFR